MGKRKGGDEGRGGGGFGGREDQYGGFGGQDRDDGGFGGGSGGGKGQGGGGSAGGGAAGANIKFQRYVPKFLQGHAGLLQRDTPADQEEPTIVREAGQDVSDDDEGDDGGALQRALEDNSALAGDDDVRLLVKRQTAQGLKEKGNAAFSSRNFTEAIRVFTQCVELDPKNEVYFSNRSAAHAAMKEYSKALEDADTVVRLKPSWAKGYARKGAAHFGLEEFSDAVSAYERAVKLEPNDEGLGKAKLKAEMAERQQAKDGKIKFKKRHTGGDGQEKKRHGGKKLKPSAAAGVGVKNKTLLSFAEDEGEGEEG